MIFLYNIFFPLGFIFFIPAMVYKLIRRPGRKINYSERFALYSADKKRALTALRAPVWIHSVSVGETMIAVSLIKKWRSMAPGRHFVLSTTTTTGQELALTRCGGDAIVIFCPVDFPFFVKKAFSIINPSILVIFETEIWPNMICVAEKYCGKLALVNARMSDKSVRGYARARMFFAPLLEKFSFISVQSEGDMKRFKAIAPDAVVNISGNMKFDQEIPPTLPRIDMTRYFGKGEYKILLAASTHPGEEKLIAGFYRDMRTEFPDVRLVIIPRHAERGAEVAAELKKLSISFRRRTSGNDKRDPVDCLLADTTGEMLSFMKLADVIIMGKSLAGYDEGHNLIEPALLGKPVITGSKMKNFRFVLKVLKEKDALITVRSDDEIRPALTRLLQDGEFRRKLGRKAFDAVSAHKGATEKTIKTLEEIL
jgi:3-deoxy-D-manno-octulosonic-acid transferase